jgi:hypothetical protein
VERVLEKCQCIAVRPVALGLIRGQNCIIDRPFDVVAAAKVKREQFRHLVVAVAIELFERVSDRAVMHPAVTLEQAPVGRLLS